MVFTEQDEAFIKILYLIICHGLWKLMTEFMVKDGKVWIGQPYHKVA